jgi:hypothetical protein
MQHIRRFLLRCVVCTCLQVLAVTLLLLAVALLRKAKGTVQATAVAGAAATAAAAATTAAKGSKSPGTGAAAPAAAAAAAAAGVVVAGSGTGSNSSGGWRLLPVQPPPVMWDPLYSLPDADAQQAGALPTDPYTSLKQNYEAVIGFLTLVRAMLARPPCMHCNAMPVCRIQALLWWAEVIMGNWCVLICHC